MSDTDPPRDEARSYIASLAAEGAAPERGQFTLDPARARELLREFRLADPATWVAEVLQAAVLSGATWLRAEITRSRVRLELDGRPFDVEDLALADNALLSGEEGEATTRRARLAAGLNGAAALALERVEVRSGAVLLERRPDAPDRITGVEDALAGTRITVERRSDPPPDAPGGWEPPEAERLAALGRFAPLALTVNDRRVSGGLALPYAAFAAPVNGEGLAGIAGIEEEAHPGEVLVVQHGTVIARETLATAPEGFLAVVEAPAVRRDLGLGQALREAALDRVIAAARSALDRILDGAARVVQRHRKTEERETLALARRTVRSAYLQGGLPERAWIRALPVWPVLARPEADDHVSLEALEVMAARKAGLPFVTRPLGAFAPADRQLLLSRKGILRLTSAADGARLAQQLGVMVLCLDDEVAPAPPEGLRHRLGLTIQSLGWPGLGLAVLILGVVPVGTMFGHRQLVREWHWPTAPARVSAAQYYRTTVGGKSRRTVYRVGVTYEYQAAGRTFRRTVNRLEDHPSEAGAQRHVDDLRRDGFRLWYDPRAPAEVHLERTPPWQAVLIGGVIDLALLVVLFFWAAHRHQQRSVAEAEESRSRHQRLVDQLDRPQADAVRRRRKRR